MEVWEAYAMDSDRLFIFMVVDEVEDEGEEMDGMSPSWSAFIIVLLVTLWL